jgi:hypothetical protein
VTSTHALARRAGVLYSVFMILAIIGQFAIPSAFVPGDAAATASRIAANLTLYRVDMLLDAVTLFLFLYLVVTLHRLFEPTDASQALLMLVLVAAGVAVSFANLLHKFGTLVIRSGLFPRILGVLLMIAGAAYLVAATTAIALPEYRRIVWQVMTPLYLGEVPIILWLLVRGASPKAPAPETSRRG